MKWLQVTATHFTLEVKELETSISVMEFGSEVVVIWKWPCKNSDRIRNVMQRSDMQIRESGKCLSGTRPVSYDNLLSTLKAIARESSPSTELLGLLARLPHWSEVEESKD